MRDITETVAAIYRLALWDPRGGGRMRKPGAHDPLLLERIHGEVHDILVDQLMSVSNAISPESEEEVKVVNWLQGRLTHIAQQLPQPEEKK